MHYTLEQRSNPATTMPGERRQQSTTVLSPRGTLNVLFVLGGNDDFSVPTFIDQNVFHLLGFTSEEVMTTGWWFEHLEPADRSVLRASVNYTSISGSGRLTYRVRDRMGQVRWLEQRMSLVQMQAGEERKIICTWSDVTHAVLPRYR